MRLLPAKTRDWLFERKLNRTLNRLYARSVLSNEPVFSNSDGIAPIKDSKKWIKPHIFETHNQIFNYKVVFKHYDSMLATEEVQRHLDDIVNSVDCGKKPVYFKWAEGIEASKSDQPKDYGKWDSFYAFGKYAYEEYLADYSKPKTKEDWDNHYERLRQFFEQLCEGCSGIHSFYYQKWCGRYFISNIDVSRRAAAIAYMAKQGNPDFDKPIVYPLIEETINPDSIKRIESIADSYIIIANATFHKDLDLLIGETKVPLGACIPHWDRNKHQEMDVRLYLLLSDNYLRETRYPWSYYPPERRDIDEALIYQRHALKPQLDDLIQRGLAVSLSQYIDLATSIWREYAFKNRF